MTLASLDLNNIVERERKKEIFQPLFPLFPYRMLLGKLLCHITLLNMLPSSVPTSHNKVKYNLIMTSSKVIHPTLLLTPLHGLFSCPTDTLQSFFFVPQMNSNCEKCPNVPKQRTLKLLIQRSLYLTGDSFICQSQSYVHTRMNLF